MCSPSPPRQLGVYRLSTPLTTPLQFICQLLDIFSLVCVLAIPVSPSLKLPQLQGLDLGATPAEELPSHLPHGLGVFLDSPCMTWSLQTPSLTLDTPVDSLPEAVRLATPSSIKKSTSPLKFLEF